MSRTISELTRSNPFSSPFVRADCSGDAGGMKVNETRTVAALAAAPGAGKGMRGDCWFAEKWMG